jgi:hypothetical protein
MAALRIPAVTTSRSRGSRASSAAGDGGALAHAHDRVHVAEARDELVLVVHVVPERDRLHVRGQVEQGERDLLVVVEQGDPEGCHRERS